MIPIVRFQMPDDEDLATFFGGDPIEDVPEDGYWCYEVTDIYEVKLRFSVNTYERSVQAELSMGERTLSVISHEAASELAIVRFAGDAFLEARFFHDDTTSTLRIWLNPHITVKSSTLLT